MDRKYYVSAFVLAAGMTLALFAHGARAADGAGKVDFHKDIQPIFKASCIKCHGFDANRPRKKPAAGLRLDDRAAAMKGGRSGAVIVPGDAKDSLLYKLLEGTATVMDNGKEHDIDPMPKVKRGEKWKPLPREQIALIKRWIDEGAAWPKKAS